MAALNLPLDFAPSALIVFGKKIDRLHILAWVSLLLLGLFAVLVVALRFPAVQLFDANASAHLNGRGGDFTTRFCHFLARVGSKGLYGAIPLFALAAWRLGQWPALKNFGILLLGHCVLLGSKSWVARPRPDSLSPFSHLDSFPSGHTLIALVLTGWMIGFWWPRCRNRLQRALLAMVWLWPILMGLSRIQMGRHFVGDVLGAWILGAAWLCGFAAFFQVPAAKRREREVKS